MQKYILWTLLYIPCDSPAQSMAIMVDKMNTLYVGVDNPLHAVVSDVSAENLVLLPSHGEITRDTAGGYHWLLCSFDSGRAWLVLADSVRENAFDTLFFRVKRLPEPEFKYGRDTHHGGGGIAGIFQHDCAEKWHCKIISFEAEFFHKNSDPVLIVNSGARFNAHVTEHLDRMIPGDQVKFTNFKWNSGCDPTVRRSDQEIRFKIK